MDDDFWGPEIVVNGVRPEWLTGRVTCDLWTGLTWCYRHTRTPHDVRAEEWAWVHTHPANEPNIIKIRLPKDHPYYNKPTITPDQAIGLINQGTKVKCPYCNHMVHSELNRNFRHSGVYQHIKAVHTHDAENFMRLVKQGRTDRENAKRTSLESAKAKLSRVHTVSGEFIQQVLEMLDPFDDSVVYEALEDVFNSNECKVW